METSNPLEQVIAITKVIKAYQFNEDLQQYRRSDGHFVAFPTISWSLGRKPDDSSGTYKDEDLLSDYISMLNIIRDARNFVSKMSNERSRPTNINLVEPIFAPFFRLSPESYADPIHSLTPASIENAQIVSNNLWEKNNSTIVSKDDIDKLLKQISLLESEINSLEIEPILKDRIRVTITLIRMAITRINLVGPEEILKDLEKLLGQSVMVVMTSDSGDKIKSRNFFENTVSLFKNTKDVVDAASTIYPVLKGVAEIAMKALGN
ncbi:hypothetical protein [Deinococcus aquaticus]|uniref:hypothetical protein n=1 Tax=Deinococcus aquaticus TaxID=328692 RepID=UPI003F46A90E